MSKSFVIRIFILPALLITSRYGVVDIQFLNETDSTQISYVQFCELMDHQNGTKTNEAEPFCTEANMSMYSGLPFVKSMAQLFSLHGAILQENTTNEGTSGDGLAHDGPRHFGSVFFNALEAKVACKNMRKFARCDEVHKYLEEEIQRSFFFVRGKKTNQYYYFTNVTDRTSGEADLARCVLLGEFTILDSSLHAESRKIFQEYARKYGKPNHDTRRNDIVNSTAWKGKSGNYLYLVHIKIGEDVMHNFAGLQEFSVDKIYAGPLYANEIALVQQRVLEKVKSIKRDQDAAQKKLLDDAIK